MFADAAIYVEDEVYYSPDGGPEVGDEDLLGAVCVTKEATGLDAYAWVKTPGESDGRLFTAGTYHPCLLSNTIECSDTCPEFVSKLGIEFQRRTECECIS